MDHLWYNSRNKEIKGEKTEEFVVQAASNTATNKMYVPVLCFYLPPLTSLVWLLPQQWTPSSQHCDGGDDLGPKAICRETIKIIMVNLREIKYVGVECDERVPSCNHVR